MKILTVDNKSYDLDTVPDEIDDIRYCVLDASNKNDVDFYFLPLVFLESFHAPAICLQIGPYTLQMPMDWSIMTCDDDYTGVEVIPLASLNNRGFRAVCLNPLHTNSLTNHEINITNIYQDVKWFMPRLKNGHMLAVPLDNAPKPKCVYFVKEVNRVCDLELGDLI